MDIGWKIEIALYNTKIEVPEEKEEAIFSYHEF